MAERHAGVLQEHESAPVRYGQGSTNLRWNKFPVWPVFYWRHQLSGRSRSAQLFDQWLERLFSRNIASERISKIQNGPFAIHHAGKRHQGSLRHHHLWGEGREIDPYIYGL